MLRSAPRQLEAPIHVGILGCGYVGLVTGACLAAAGHVVRLVDVDAERVAAIARGEAPFHEPGLAALLEQQADRMTASVDRATLADCAVVFLALPTPSLPDGACDTSILFDALLALAPNLADQAVLVVKSTVPVGTTERIEAALRTAGRGDVAVAMNPEFLREGSAVSDFQRPDRVVVGSTSDAARQCLGALYAPFVSAERPLIFADPRTAELCKYAANAYLGMRLAWVNELAGLADQVGAQVDTLLAVVGADPRIGPQYLSPGPGYGGSCLPKDVPALAQQARAEGLELHLVEATDRANRVHQQRILDLVIDALGARPAARLALWGLAFKAGSDDVRASFAVLLLQTLAGRDVEVVAWDPAVGPQELGELSASVARFASDPLDCAEGADVVVLLTEWPELRTVPLDQLATAVRGRVLVDTRNLLDRQAVEAAGLVYRALGR